MCLLSESWIEIFYYLVFVDVFPEGSELVEGLRLSISNLEASLWSVTLWFIVLDDLVYKENLVLDQSWHA